MPRQLIKLVDHITFPKVVGELMRNDPQFEGIEYTANFPRENVQHPVVCYRLIKRVPGMDNIETRKPRLRKFYHEDDGTLTEIWSQWMTCVFQFDIVAPSAVEADDIVWKFDWLLRNNVGHFLNLGASEMVFEEQLEDALLPRDNDNVVRSLRWLTRLESIEARNNEALQLVKIRCLYPQEDTYEEVVRGASVDIPDTLSQTHISKILYVSDPSPSGLARTEDYLPGIDFVIIYDPQTALTHLLWQEAGKKPAAGATYLVRYLHWTAFARLSVPPY